jgi:putative NADH-flavin reductase
MQTILGAGGAIGTELVEEFARTGHTVRLVSRNPKPIQGATETISADISDFDQTIRAVSGSSIVYLLVGLKSISRPGIRNGKAQRNRSIVSTTSAPGIPVVPRKLAFGRPGREVHRRTLG